MGGNDTITPKHMRLFIATPTTMTKDKYDADMTSENPSPKGPIPDTATLSEHDVKNDAILYVTFARAWESGVDSPVSDEDDAWEVIEVVEP